MIQEKDNKELFTGGEWKCGGNDVYTGYGKILVTANNELPYLESRSNLALFAEAKNIYYALKKLTNELEDKGATGVLITEAKAIINRIDRQTIK